MTQKQWGQAVTLALDVFFLNLAFYLSYVVRYDIGIPTRVPPQYDAPFYPAYIPYAIFLTVLCLITYRINGLYERRRGSGWIEETYRLITGTMTSIVAIMAVTFFLQPLVYSRGMLILAGLLIVASLSLARLIQRWVEAWLRKHGIGVERVLIVGMGEVGRAVARSLMGSPELGYQIIGYVDDDPNKGDSRLGRIRGYGGIDNLPGVITSEKIDEVIVTLPWMYHRKILQIVSDCERESIRVRVVPDVFQQRMRRIDIDSLNGIPLIGSGPARMSPSAVLVKRALDLSLVSLAIPLLLPLFLITALIIRLDSSGPIFFTHPRVGKDGKVFGMYKFRTMVVGADKLQAGLAELNEADGPMFKIKDDPRRTRIGGFLRKTSIDELPQLINVLRGEMSIVGPRPGTPEEVAQYEAWQTERISVRPGITGLWQVSGRSNIPFAEMCLLDIFYIENWSLDLDIRIMLQTIPNVLLGNGAF
jgi:exopolysaccharide biosynthesis polyprenyl glycosylphosphotransferase